MKVNPLLIYETLLAHYGDPHWWPAKTPYEVIVGAILTQNTTWINVEKAICNMKDKMSPECISAMPEEELAQIIRPTGFFNQKSKYLKAITEWYCTYNYDVEAVQRENLDKIRGELLATRGIGEETADSILLYAFGFSTFVVDAYTYRLCERYPFNAGNNYASVKEYFESRLSKDSDIYNNFHALIVINGKEHCKKQPSCSDCPLRYECKRFGL